MKKTKGTFHLQTLTELLKQNLPHVHRARLRVKKYRRKLSSKKFKNRRLSIYGQKVFFSWKSIKGENTRSEYLFTISNRFIGKEMLKMYAQRWSIEQMFSHWKKRGFDFEGTHVTHCKALLGLISLILHC